MNVRIGAIFESPYSAEVALDNLRSNGIELKNVYLHEVEHSAHAGKNRADSYYFPAYATGMGSSGVTRVFTGGLEPDITGRSGAPKEIRNDEAVLEFDVDKSNSEKARNIIISSRCSRITS